MTSWVIVAIPSEQDHVWKISSEKVPHLTMLFLGEQDGTVDEQRMAEFIEHVANTSLNRFGLSVDRRGVLGSEEADVLFFEKGWSTKRLEDVRAQLLQDTDIARAYHSVEQYPEWTPHLTLGYPETPAKKDDRDYSVGYVEFDRIALWTGDYEGPEFVLSNQYTLTEAAAWGMTLKEMEEKMSDDTLAHYGVPGMRWGKRTNPKGGPSSKELRALDKSGRRKDAADAADAVSKAEADRNAKIDAARLRIKSGEAKTEYKSAKAKYQHERYIVGKYQAKKALNQVKDKNYQDLLTSREIKSGKEAVQHALGKLAGDLVLAGISGGVRK